jgi:hypothetical protein
LGWLEVVCLAPLDLTYKFYEFGSNCVTQGGMAMVRRAMMAWALLVWLAVGVLGAGPKEKPAIPPELPPFPLSTQQAKQYQEAAAEFLSEHRDSAHAPLVLSSLVMLAQIARQEDKVLDLRHRLVLQYPRSVPAAHLVSVLEHASDYRKILRVEIDRDPTVLRSKTYAQAFFQAIELGIAHWGGAKFLDDEKLMVEAAVAAHLTEHKTAPQLAAYVRAKGKRMTRKVVEAFVDPKTSDAEKLQALYMLDEDAPTAVCLEVLWDRLPAAERTEVAPLRARVDYLCRKGELAQAHLALKDLRHEDAQLQFLQIWTAINREDNATIDALLSAMQKTHANSNWTRTAEKLLARSGDVEKNLAAQAELWMAAAKLLRDPRAGIEADVAMGADVNGFRYRGYLAIAPSERLFELQLRDANQTIVAYEATPKAARLYAADESQITEFPAKDVFPAIRWTGSDDAGGSGKPQFGFRFNVVSADAFEFAAGRALDLPLLRSQELIKETLAYLVERGNLPCTVVKQTAGISVAWIRPNPRTGELSECVFDFDSDSRIRGVRSKMLEVSDVHYAGDPDWPDWPELPVKKLDSFDASAFIKIMGALAKVAESVSPKDEGKEDVAGGGPAAK